MSKLNRFAIILICLMILSSIVISMLYVREYYNSEWVVRELENDK